MKTLTLLLFFLVVCENVNSQKSVLLDNYYNQEIDKKTGHSYHYLWSDTSMTGFSQLGTYFKQKQANTNILRDKPTLKNLEKAAVYIIVDPDTKYEVEHPNYMDSVATESISKWVKKGGVLLLLANNFKNAELDSFNILANKFGMHFSNETLHYEQSENGKPRNFNSCASTNLPNHSLFKNVSKIFLKEIAPIQIGASARAVLVENNQVIIAEAHYGKGYVLAIGDPWLYNEYIGHRFLPADFNNEKAAENLVSLLINKTTKK